MKISMIIVAPALVGALFGLAACGGGGGGGNSSGDGKAAQTAKALFAPAVKVKGSMVTATGDQANGCVLEIYNVATGDRVKESTVSGRFSISFQDPANMDGLRFRGLCDGVEVYRSRDYSADKLANMGWKVSLGEIMVARGAVTVSGRVVDEAGASPEGCSVGVYPAGRQEPVTSWPAAGDYSGAFELAQSGNMFTIEASCPGYAKRGTSGVYGPNMVDSETNSIRTRDLVVKK
jgi:hypothetical protein